MDEEEIGLGVIPPSPVASSTQRPINISTWLNPSTSQSGQRDISGSQREQRHILPRLPPLPNLQLGTIGIDSDEAVDIIAGTEMGNRLSRGAAAVEIDSDVSSVNSDRIEIDDNDSDVLVVSDSDDASSTNTIQPHSPSGLAPGESSHTVTDRVSDVVPALAPGDHTAEGNPTVVAGSSSGPSDEPLQSNAGGSSLQPGSSNTAIDVRDPTPVTTPAAGNHESRVIVQALGAGDSPGEFRQVKRKRVASPVKPSTAFEDKEEEDGECCPICFEPWTTSGLHRLSSLKCGHLFGQSCIEKWLKGQGGKCPHCNAKAKRKDVRVLYAKTIKALDTTERDHALKELEKERESKRKIEMDCAQLRLQYQKTIEENNRFKMAIEKLKLQVRYTASLAYGQGPSSSVLGEVKASSNVGKLISGQFVLDKTIKIWDGGNCRVMAYSPSLATLVVSQPSSSTLFPGYGIKKISTLDFKTSQYLTIHSKAIRDLSFHPSVDDGMLLSCGLDKKVKMTSLLSNAVVQTYDTPVPAWSCVWHAEDRNYLYAGLQNGLVLEFDVRNTGEAVREINVEGSRSPVASLCFMPKDMTANFRPGGLLIGKLDQVSFYELLQNDATRLHYLPLSGSLTSLHIEPNTRHILASYRPTAKNPTIRHQLCEMIAQNISADPTVIASVCSCNVIHTFHGGRMQTALSKTTVIQHPGDSSRLLVCGNEETSNSVHLWDSGTGQLAQRLVIGGSCVDMCSFHVNNHTYLATLTDTQCKVFKWT